MPRKSVETARESARERRKSPRKATIRGGTIVYGTDRRTMYCVLLDVSDGGAKLVAADVFTCPDRFSLEFADQPARDCEVVWRQHSHVGVKFVV